MLNNHFLHFSDHSYIQERKHILSYWGLGGWSGKMSNDKCVSSWEARDWLVLWRWRVRWLFILVCLHLMRRRAMKVQALLNDVFIKSMVLNDDCKDTSDPASPVGQPLTVETASWVTWTFPPFRLSMRCLRLINYSTSAVEVFTGGWKVEEEGVTGSAGGTGAYFYC